MAAPSTVAITGLRTFLGQRLAQRLLAQGPGLGVVGIDVRRPYRLEGRVRWHRVDLTDPTADGSLAEVFERERVDAVVHAAFRSEPTSDLEYDHELETLGSLHVLNACAAVKVRRLVLASSTMLYGAHPDNPQFLGEEHPLRGHPAAHGIRNRIEVEELVAKYARRHPEAEVTVLRTGWIMGPSYEDHVVRMFARPVVPTLLGYDPMLQFVHEEDVLRVFERAVLERHPGVFNLVGEGPLPLSTLLALAGKRRLPVPAPLWYRVLEGLSQGSVGDPPAGFYDYLRYGWLADGARAWCTFGPFLYTSREAWISFVSSRRMRQYR